MGWQQSDRVRRLSGVIGFVGAMLFFAGDMLFYGHVGPGTEFAEGLRDTVTHASTGRLFAGGLVGPIAACLCIMGFWHVYLNVCPRSAFLGRVMLAAFSMLMVGGSAVHVLWAAKGLAIKYCYGQGSPCSDLLSATSAYWSLAYNVAAVPGYLAALLLIVLVALRKTWYPRWTIFANPAALAVLSPLAHRTGPRSSQPRSERKRQSTGW